MREKFKFIVLIGLCMIIFTACGKESKFNEKQKTILADYIAQTVIEHSEGYETKLVDVSESPFLLKKEENDDAFSLADNKALDSEGSKEESVIKTGSSGAIDEGVVDNSDEKKTVSKSQLASILGFEDGIEAYVSNKKILKEYDSNSYIIDVEKNKHLVEVIFKITNTTDSNVKVKTECNNVKYRLKIGEEIYYPLLTAIDNDLLYYEKKIKSKKSGNAVLLFSVKNGNNKEEMVLEVEGKDTSASISLD